MLKIRVLSYNIHKGFDAVNWSFVLNRMKSSVRDVNAELVLLQEVLGHHKKHGTKLENWPTTSQFEYLADEVWPHFAYGLNSAYDDGHHGNAILSKYPISFWENQDVSQHQLERRGLLHAEVKWAGEEAPPLHVICVHLGLFEGDRKNQALSLVQRISSMVPPESPVLIGGDFNDWRENLTEIFERELGLQEAFRSMGQEHARTFPSWMPVFRLDRIYFRGMECKEVRLLEGKPWSELSDHLPILAEFELKKR